MFVNTDDDEASQLPKGHYGVPQLCVFPAGHVAYPGQIEETRVETDYKITTKSNPISIG